MKPIHDFFALKASFAKLLRLQKLPFRITPQIERYLEDILYFHYKRLPKKQKKKHSLFSQQQKKYAKQKPTQKKTEEKKKIPQDYSEKGLIKSPYEMILVSEIELIRELY